MNTLTVENRSSECRYGFTLIELLVVVAIIAVLIAILLPALSNAREQARKVVCQSNTKQLAQVLAFYEAEFSDFLCPPENRYIDPTLWSGDTTYKFFPYPVLIRKYTRDAEELGGKIRAPGKTKKYTDKEIQWGPISGNCWGGSTILQCPSNKVLMKYTFSVHYGMNENPWLYAAQSDPKTQYLGLNPSWWKVSAVREPSRVFRVAESDASWQGVNGYDGGYGHRLTWLHYTLGQWHLGGTNVLYFDGHSEYLTWFQMERACVTAYDAQNGPQAPWYAHD